MGKISFCRFNKKPCEMFSNLHACMGRIDASKMCILIIIKEIGNAKLGWNPISPKTPAVSNCFVYIKMLTMYITEHLFNLSIYRTVLPRKF